MVQNTGYLSSKAGYFFTIILVPFQFVYQIVSYKEINKQKEQYFEVQHKELKQLPHKKCMVKFNGKSWWSIEYVSTLNVSFKVQRGLGQLSKYFEKENKREIKG